MTQNELAATLSARHAIDRDVADDVVRDVFRQIGAVVANGEKVQIAHFGTFYTKERPARTARNPATGGTVDVPATTYVRFKAAPRLRSKVAA